MRETKSFVEQMIEKDIVLLVNFSGYKMKKYFRIQAGE
jgi:hypothetical protein